MFSRKNYKKKIVYQIGFRVSVINIRLIKTRYTALLTKPMECYTLVMTGFQLSTKIELFTPALLPCK